VFFTCVLQSDAKHTFGLAMSQVRWRNVAVFSHLLLLSSPTAKGATNMTITEFPNVTRVELISEKGREVVKYGQKEVSIQLQDDGRTLKIFTDGRAKDKP
jgi:hypothetical protein